MCGIAGFWDPSHSADATELEQIALRMASVLRDRGPDDQGTWADADTRLALGHRRLAILDLSSEGHQPMRSADGRYMLVFNGEIYNFEDLRRSLEETGHSFRGRSDTEVMLAALCEWGLLLALERFLSSRSVGMAESFALSNLLSRYPREAEAIARELGVRPFVPLEDERVSALVDERLRLAESRHPLRRLRPADPVSLFEF